MVNLLDVRREKLEEVVEGVVRETVEELYPDRDEELKEAVIRETTKKLVDVAQEVESENVVFLPQRGFRAKGGDKRESDF